MFSGLVPVNELIEQLRSHPDEMRISSKFIAVYDSELDMAIMIPGRFERMPESQARIVLNENLRSLKQK